MALVTVINDKELAQLQQILAGFVGQLEQIILNLRDDTEVEVSIKFNKRKKNV